MTDDTALVYLTDDTHAGIRRVIAVVSENEDLAFLDRYREGVGRNFCVVFLVEMNVCGFVKNFAVHLYREYILLFSRLRVKLNVIVDVDRVAATAMRRLTSGFV